jgi:serine/threonine-protein kinase
LTVADKYYLKDFIGEGAMGRVYKAEQLALRKPFAVKILLPALTHDEASQQRFANEAHNAASLNHPNCVSVVDYGRTSDGAAYIVMEYVEGTTLEQIIAEHFPLAHERIIDVTLQVLAALSEAHGLGILHRDLKPDNILVQTLRTHGELAKVLDFGIAKLMDAAPTASQRPGLTNQGMVCGTPEYMSPEQARGQQLDPRSDLYSVGVVLYQMLTGRPPFESASAIEVLHMHLHDEPIPPSQLNHTEPGPLEAVCLQALAKDPDERFTSANDFRESLVAAASEREKQCFHCQSCGGEMRVEDRFCPACGAPAPVRRSPAQRKRHPTRRSGLNIALRRDHERTAEVVVRNFPLPLVGRGDLLSRAHTRLSRPQDELFVQALAGPSGVGKTRLADEIASLAEQLGWRVFYVGADPSNARTRSFSTSIRSR